MNCVDEKEFEHAGLLCLVRMVEGDGMRHRCGYVRVPVAHRFAGCHYDYVHEHSGVDVHGGLTYADERRPGEWWFGFDCAHFGDSLSKWTLEAVEGECKRLAEQLAAITNEKAGEA